MKEGISRRVLENVYGSRREEVERQQQRYRMLEEWFEKCFGAGEKSFFSVPGRTEIGGNHTDHNHGRVLAAGINLDTIAVARPNKDNKVILYSEGYDRPFEVSLDTLTPRAAEEGSTAALIRGVAARLQEWGYRPGGFNACVSSEVPAGLGLSSSAAIEVLCGAILSALYNQGRIPPDVLARAGQYAENVFFGKPCGLMDQMACATGGIIAIDFKEPQKPLVEKIDFDFESRSCALLIVDTGGGHADLTADYAAIPGEMKAVAGMLGGKVCRDVDEAALLKNLSRLRAGPGDRAVLRALHFFRENQRVSLQAEALRQNDFQRFLALVNASGNSSFKALQNIYSTENVREQSVSLALILTEGFIEEHCPGRAACRVHGGGFAGTIQLFLPREFVERYTAYMHGFCGPEKIVPAAIRPYGAIHLGGTD